MKCVVCGQKLEATPATLIQRASFNLADVFQLAPDGERTEAIDVHHKPPWCDTWKDHRQRIKCLGEPIPAGSLKKLFPEEP